MKKMYCIKCNKYRESKNPKISYNFKKKIFLSITCDKWDSDDNNIHKGKEHIWILKVLGLSNNINE